MKEESTRRDLVEQQTEAFKAALSGTFDGMLKGTFPPVPPPAVLPGVASSAAAQQQQPQQQHQEGSGASTGLSKAQLRLLEAELGHGISLTDGSEDAVVAKLAPFLKSAKNSKAAGECIQRYLPGSSIPRSLSERASLLFKAIQEQ